ncbi:MAG: tRNA lysidine(34) synthetase TilS [Planctomycetaceae bacterium]|nr:tRNA lysidine(34) synthetase TilS [Planctomycetaceae bacterium]
MLACPSPCGPAEDVFQSVLAMNDSPLLGHLAQAAGELQLGRLSVLIGVSGGADSVALLRGLLSLGDDLRPIVQVAHLNHKLRGATADADAVWLKRLCETLAVPLTIGIADVAQAARDAGRGIEEAARDERYRFLEQTARQLGCRAIAVAHTADDQAETILHHILRGTGLAGLSGMPAERPLPGGARLIRPLLAARRADVLNYLQQIGQDFREDESNQDEKFTRNRLRRRVLPELAREFNPQLIDALGRLGQQASQTQAALTDCAAGWLDRVLESETPCSVRLKWQPLAGRPRHLVREVLTALWRRQNWPRQEMSFDHWDRLTDVLESGGAADFPGGISARRTGRLIVIEKSGVP